MSQHKPVYQYGSATRFFHQLIHNRFSGPGRGLISLFVQHKVLQNTNCNTLHDFPTFGACPNHSRKTRPSACGLKAARRSDYKTPQIDEHAALTGLLNIFLRSGLTETSQRCAANSQRQRGRVIYRAILLVAAIASVALLNCTPYKPNGAFGGYSDVRLSEDTFRVRFNGNGYTSPDRAQDLCLLRAAELALNNNFPFFIVIDEHSGTTATAFTTAGHADHSGIGTFDRHGFYYSGTTTYHPPTAHYTFRPNSGLLIKCFETVPTNAWIYNAQMIFDDLASKYGLKKSKGSKPASSAAQRPVER